MNDRSGDRDENATSDDEVVAVLHGTPSQIGLDESPKQREARLRKLRAFLNEPPPTDVDELDVRMHEEMLARLNRDYTLSVVPVGFLLHETPEIREERIRRTLAGLAERRTGDPAEHRETLEALLAALDGDQACPETDQTE